ncbi:MAG: diguanylate cyclase [Bacillota bacterium]
MFEGESRVDAGPNVGLVRGRTIAMAVVSVTILYAAPLLLYFYDSVPQIWRSMSLGGPILAAMLASLLLGRAGLAVASIANAAILVYFGREVLRETAEIAPELALAVMGAVFATQVAASIIAVLVEKVRRTVSDMRETNHSLERLALLDEMTGLYNFRYFAQRVEEEIARADRLRKSLVLIIVDIDHFKHYNDTYGHPQGDRALIKLAGLLRRSVRRSDVVFRYGGEEFIILAPGADGHEGMTLAERVRFRVGVTDFSHGSGGSGPSLSVSAGFSVYPDWAQGSQELLLQADEALYHAKRQGGDRVERYPDAAEVDEERAGEDGAVLAAVRTLLNIISARDGYTYNHSQRVMKYSLGIGHHMGLEESELRVLQWSALIHDLGKIELSRSLLMKSRDLDRREWESVRRHPDASARLVEPVMERMGSIAEVVRAHHEHYDGGGYPRGLEGSEIPFHARILAVADAIDAMLAERPYRPGVPREEVVEELWECAGSQFDPEIVEAAVRFLRHGTEVEEGEVLPVDSLTASEDP